MQAVAADQTPPHIRFCPADAARTYPLDGRNRVQGLLAPNALQCSGVPVTFSNLKVQWADTERALPSGDSVTAK